MLVGHLDFPETVAPLFRQPTWQEAFAWVRQQRSSVPKDGEYLLRGSALRAIVQTVPLGPRDGRLFEAHRKEIDLHVCLEGSEWIEWAPAALLTPHGSYETGKDTELFALPSEAHRLVMVPGAFAIFFPGDAHLPGLLREHLGVRKFVVKILAPLLPPQR